ncbi:unnamed protein product [marine sediment metagenome]|uniref:Uncharacterized protein n=1 Tax=marine sediment metagenome TaxID=412755 RepID=X1P0V6_9ZZZZ
MKQLRLLLMVSLLVAMFLCTNAIAYADEGETDNSDSTVGEEVNSNTDTAVDDAPDAVESNPGPVDCGADSSDSAASGDAVESGEDNSDLTVNVGVQGDNVELNVAVNADSADVLVVVDSEDPEVNVLTGDNSEVNMGVGQDSSIYLNGQNINQPTVIHPILLVKTSGSSLSTFITTP